MDFLSRLLKLATDNPARKVQSVSLADLRQLSAASDLSLVEGALAAAQHGVFPSLLVKNAHSLSPDMQARLLRSSVLLVGVGGLGGYVLELLARIGVGTILVADGDIFEESNLNRQLVSSVPNIGKNKAIAAAERAAQISPLIQVRPLDLFLDAENIRPLVEQVDIVIDALGGIAPRAAIHAAAHHAGKPVVSAAVAGWTAVVGSESPGTKGISLMWEDPAARDAEHSLGSLAPAACLSASLQAVEVVSFLTEGRLKLDGCMLHADLATFSFELLHLT